MKKPPLRWIWKKTSGSRILLFFLLVSNLGIAAANLGMTMVLKAFTDIATNSLNVTIANTVVFATVIVVLEGLFLTLRGLCTRLAKARMERRLRVETVHCLAQGDLREEQKTHSADWMTRLTGDVETVTACIPTLINTVFNGCLMAVLALIVMFMLSWKLTVAILIAIPLLIGIVSVFSPKLQKRIAREKKDEDVSRSLMQDVLDNILLLQAFQAQRRAEEKLDQQQAKKYQATRSVGFMEGLLNFFNNSMGTIMFLIVMGYGAYLTLAGEFTVGSMIATVQLLNYVTWPFSNIAQAISQVNQAKVSAQRILEALALPESAMCAIHEGNTDSHVQVSKLEISDLSFWFSEDALVLRDLSFSVARGHITGIWGRSGSGKSTLLRLILGAYAPESGSLALIREDKERLLIPGREASHHMAYVPSDHMVWSGSVLDNIVMGEAYSPAREKDVWNALEAANLDEFVKELPSGLDTLIGKGGQAISSGQEQRLSLARAFFRDAELLILDEPTSNLDTENIERLKEQLQAMRGNRMILLVTHDQRLASVCDDLFVLENHQFIRADHNQIAEFPEKKGEGTD